MAGAKTPEIDRFENRDGERVKLNRRRLISGGFALGPLSLSAEDWMKVMENVIL
jgi:hypothetical protein